jgi:hypothetical protein
MEAVMLLEVEIPSLRVLMESELEESKHDQWEEISCNLDSNSVW